MTPKEKAEELADKYFPVVGDIDRMKCNSPRIYMGFVVQCALIAVDEIRDNLPLISEIQQHWIEVKQEINLL